MAKNLVLCADGTCNAFGARSSSNVAKLVRLIDLHDRGIQLAVYQQGLGTLAREHEHIRRYAEAGATGEPARALLALPPPAHASRWPWDWPSIAAAMTRGEGLDENLRALYRALVTQYRTGDKVFLFGFSRGAFTVRALAGLVWRHGIPAAPSVAQEKGLELDEEEVTALADAAFDRAWPRFRDEYTRDGRPGTSVLRPSRGDAGLRDCVIHFMGLWDTVKSYGGLRPIVLPHLRHNPGVRTVRHAVALDERRGWFDTTTWGWLDSDHPEKRNPRRQYPVDRIPEEDRRAIERQCVKEVWFTGCHANVGGGDGNDATADIALRWMIGEAAAHELRLNGDGERFVQVLAAAECPRKKESRNLFWAAVERIERQAIDNSGLWPTLHTARGASPRRRDNWRRRTIWLHESARDRQWPDVPEGCRLEIEQTTRTIPG